MRIRKEVNRLTYDEKFKLNNALKQAMLDRREYEFNFASIANYHGAPFTICTDPELSWL